jgi:LicD family protein
MGHPQPNEHGARILELRDAALTHISGENPNFSAGPALAEFEAMDVPEPDRMTPAYLEANIALIIATGKRQRRAQKSLYRLFQTRLAKKEGAEFAEFQDKLKEAGTRGVSLKGLSFFQSFATLDHDQVWGDTGAAIENVKSLVGEAFLNSGTLLGSVREKSFIAHDDDVDIAVLLKANTAPDAAREWIDVYHRLQAEKLISKPPRRNYGVFKLKSSSGINIDVFPAWIEDDRMYIYPHTWGELAASDVFPLAKCPTTGLPVPNNAEAMLAVNYGEAWRTPDPTFSFPWARANRRFASFRDVLTADTSVWDLK